MKDETLYKNKYLTLIEQFKVLKEKFETLQKKLEHYKKDNLRLTEQYRENVKKIDFLERLK